MKANRFKLSIAATERLRLVKGRTGFKTDNIIPRIGFCLSLAEKNPPNPNDYDQDGKEFNRYTLLGEWDDIYLALFRENLKNHKIDSTNEFNYFRAHLNRGVIIASRLIKSLPDIAKLVKFAQNDMISLPKESA